MNIDFNKNEDAMKLKIAELKMKLAEISLGGGKEKIEKQLMKLVKRSEKDGSAIGIGHVKPKTLNVLSDQIPRLKKMGYKFEFVSNMLH